MALTPEQKRARLAELLRDKARQSRRAPVSFSQERMWLQERMEPGSAALNSPSAVRLSGALDAEALRRALQELVQRHEALRTTFVEQNGRVLQHIAAAQDVALPVVDAHDGEAEAWRRLHADARQPFDLEKGPLLRAVLYRWAPGEHLLLLNVHHIVSDGWTMGVLVRELGMLYPALATGQPASLPPLPLQYADFATWQRDWLRGETLDTQLGYWRQELDPSAVLELPTDRPRTADTSTRGARQTRLLPPQLLESLRALALREGRTLFTVLLSAWQVLLSRYSGQDDVVVGSPVAGRNRAELEGLVGLFVNTVALRADLSGDPSFVQLLGRVHEKVLGAFAHQDLPFEKVVEALRPGRQLGVSPLFQVLFALQNAPLPPLHAPGLVMEAQPVDSGAAQVDLTLLATELPQGLRTAVVYRTDLFDDATVTRLLAHFQTLLESLAAHPERRLSALPMLSAAERHQVLVDWNATTAEYPRASTLPDVFAQVVARFPDHVAVESGDSRLTYRQLDARANQLAWHLRELGVSTDSRVAIAMERSLELVVALVAILKAGGAYVPLDASYPRERLVAMVEDARPQVLVTTRAQVAHLPVEGLTTVVLEDVPLATRPATAPPPAALPDSLAYIDFTSGSTGRPKGVGTPHAAVLRTVFGVDFARFGPEETFLLLAPVSFDASTLELWGALLHGSRLVVMPPQTPSLEELGEVLRRTGVTTLWLTAGLFTQMVDGNLDGLRTVKQLLTGGDVVSAPHARRVLDTLHIPVTNGYGPTESTVFATSFRLTDAAQVGASLPIGRPLANTRVYVLDAHGQPVPVGVPGELFIGGDGLARGYVEQPGLTAERFVPDAFSGVPGARLYRTGDRVRWSAAGTLEFLGRLDAQVKLRGYRIELPEIEAVLLGHPEVREAVAVVREDVPGDKRLIGYVVAPESLDTAALRAWLKERLPDYMVPSALVRLESFPLTANAKVNRKALPAPDAEASGSAREYVAPRTPTEEGLAALWAEVLRVPRVGALDNFFELGGHSLLATQVASRVRSTFGVELSLRTLFAAPTLEELAARIDSARGYAPGSPTSAPVPVPRTQALPLSFAQQRLWFIDQLEPGSATYNMPTFVRLEGALNVAALQHGLTALVARHEALRTVFRQEAGQPRQLILPQVALPLGVVDLGGLAPDTARDALEQQLREDTLRPFDLTTGPLIRAGLWRLSATEHVLALNMHHIVSDGWSMGVLVREVAALYEAALQGRPSPLPPLPLQYADYAVWQRQWLQGPVLDAQLAWWRQQLAGAPHALELPTDRPRPAVPAYRGAQVPVLLPADVSSRLKALSQQEGATPFMALLAAFQVLLSRYSGQRDICVGSPIAGRQRGELEGLIGFFVNTLVMRATVEEQASFRHLLRQVKQSALGAYAHQDVPFERLVEELQSARDLSRGPLFQVLFALQNAPATSPRMEGLALHTLEVELSTAKFELELILTESADGYRGTLRYDTGLFEASTVRRMMGNFRALVEGLVTRPEAPLASVPLLSGAERRQVLVDWNATTAGYPRTATLPEVFAQVVARFPDKVAVEFEGTALTYRQLDARANQLAHHLRALGVSTDARVATCVERSLELMVTLVAVLKAGGAYVPLDPAYPRERLAAMVEDARPQVLVTTRALLAKLPLEGLSTVVLEDAPLATRPDTAPAPAALPDSLAYIDFTSGSTGRPKGVSIPHRAVLRTVFGADYAHLGPDETLLQLAPISFDASTFEVWGALLHGARLVVFPPHPPSVEELGRVLRDAHVTTLWLTAGLFTQVVESGLEALRPLKQLLTGGDVVPAPHARRVLEELGISVTNGYGPTESTVFATSYRMTEPSQPGTAVPIGRPLANTRVYVLDGYGQPVPVGVTGELFIGGDGLARGYVEQPGLTAERFVPDAFSGVPGARLYRTGDLGRWRKDGLLEFVGRMDAQVKVRGYRIELSEIEAALLASPGVGEAVALAREDRPGDKRLVAYVVPAPADADAPRALDTVALRAFVAQRLPDYMVPSALVVLDALPLSANGKVDRKALPAPDLAVLAPAHAYVAPRTNTEELLAALWAQVLGVPRVGAEDDFFALGGHSLLATQVASRIRSTFGVAVPLRELFKAPVLSALARTVDAARRASQGLEVPELAPTPRTGPLPLSFAQQRLWFIDQLEPGSATYNMPFALRLEGVPDVAGLQQSLSEVVRRHEALRTTFASRDGEPVQLIHPPAPLPLPVVDLGSLPASERPAAARRLAAEEALRPFDLSRGPLLRTVLLSLGEKEHLLLLTMHHIVSDGWSMGVLVRELGTLYAAHVNGTQARMPPLPVQYADFAVWQRGWLRGEALETRLEYWKRQLAGAPALLELPTDKPRPSVPKYRGARKPFALGAPLSEGLKALSRREGVTPFMTLLAAWQALLARYSGQDDLVVGSPIAGRNRSETEGLIGLFANTLALRSRIDRHASFTTLLHGVKETTLAAYEHQDVPFEKLVEELKPERSLSHTPIFQVMFSLRNMPVGRLELPGLNLQAVPEENIHARFDLDLFMTDGPTGFVGALDYDTGLFDAATAARLLEHYQVLLEGAVSRPEQPIAELPLLAPEERRQLLVDFQGRPEAWPRDVCLHTLIEAQVCRTPDAEAVRFEDQALTYAQLDARADRLASWLRHLGAGPEMLVGVCLERSLDMMVALLAILKSGAAYVPLDPAYPRERLAGMLEDAAAPVLLTHRRFVDALPPHASRIVCLDEDWVSSVPQASEHPAPAASPDALAYVIFTSGSTGRPKGATNAHTGIVNRLLWMQQEYGLTPADTVLQKTPFSFDVSVWEFFWPLMTGARLVFAKPGGHQDPAYLARLMADERVTTVHFVPSMLQAFVEEPGLEGLTHLRRLLCSGEALPAELVRRAHQRLPSTEVHNLYGPTEAAVDVTYHACPRDELARGVPIGRPVANTQILILDGTGQPVPVGVAGELFIGGIQVGRGYWRRPELTAERFIPDAFSGVPGARLYRTGDVARWRPDGTVEYLGRADFQVKVRGLRIELGEIESALRQQPRVHDTVVVAREDRPGDKRLVAYVVAREGSTVDTAALRSALLKTLPEFMVPTTMVVLPALPLSPSGKVDRKALPAPALDTAGKEYVAPRTPLEERLAGLFQQVLGLERVGVTDSFFELGGHSLLATQLASRVRAAFDVELPLRAVFEAPTVEKLAARVGSATTAQGSEAPSLAPHTAGMPLSFAQQRLWFIDQLEPGGIIYNMPFALRLVGALDVGALQSSITDVVARHESLRTTFASREGQPVQLIHPPTPFHLSVVDLRDLPAAERQPEARRQALAEASRPFDLGRGPLLRAVLLRIDDSEHVLLLTLHHIVSDGWSTGVLVREIGAVYAARTSGMPATLPPLPMQYAGFAKWQRGWLQGDVLSRQLDYWKQQLTGAPALLELPTDRPRPAVPTYRGGKVSIPLSPDLTGSIKALSQRHGVTPFMVLLAAFQALLHRYSGQDDLVVGSPIAGRNRSETEGLIGFFVNTLVLRSRVTPSTSFARLLEQVRETTLGAYEHQDVPFEKLVEELRPQRDASYSPLFQVIFALQNTPMGALELPGLRLEPLEAGEAGAKTDLEFNLMELPQGYLAALRYSKDLFDVTTMTRLLEHYRTLLHAAVARPAQLLSALPLMDASERQQLLGEWSATASDYPRESTLPEVFSQVVARFPDHVAVEFGDSRLTYRQLDARANQLAHHLRRLGVTADSRVALAVERSLELIVSLVAILKAGGAYVPLDPSYPRERLAGMVEDTRPQALVTTRAFVSKLPAEGLSTVVLEDAALASEPTHAPSPAALPDSLAYVDFTSGSTGRPKGVGTTHRNVLRTLLGVDFAHFGPDETLLQLAPISFDASTLEVWGALLHGARLVVMPPQPPSLEELEQVLRDARVTTLWLTAGLFTQVVESNLQALRPVKQLLAGGDVVPPSHARRVLEELGIPLTNGYGPTETTVFAACFRMTDPAQPGTSVPIGRPIGGTRLYVLDAHGQPVPVGVTGELFIGGDGLARGYIGQPALTAERFIPDAFSGVPGARLYRTGDLVRWLHDGTLDFIGRADSQVKLRGFRIELGEVQSVLAGHPGVREAVVLVREDRPGDKRLVGYVAAPESLDTATLRDFLKQRLPEYMVPSALVRLDALPLTTNGKVDRKALPAPELGSAPDRYVAPRTPTEERLAALWAEVLGLPRVGAEDNFFEVGGHSLLATQVVSRIRVSLGVELALRELFKAPTLAALAAQVDTQLRLHQTRDIPRLVARPRTEAPPLSFAQQRLWFIDQLEPGGALYNMPFALRLEGSLDVGALEASLSQVVARHESLRTTFALREGEPVQLIHPHGAFPLPVVDLRDVPASERPAEARRLALAESSAPFDLGKGPLLRAVLLRLQDSEHILLLTMHHIVSDGWSMGVLVRELGILYAARATGAPAALPPLPVQYADYATWQRGWLKDGALKVRLDYWRHQLSGAPALLELPTDKPRPAVQSRRGSHQPFVLPADLSRSIKAFSQRHGATPFMTLLAAFQVLLYRYSGQDDITVGSPIAGRTQSETEGLIGFFVNTLVLRSHIVARDTFSSLLARVKETTLGGYEHQDVPFEKLVEELRPERSLSYSPLFQVMFSLMNAPMGALELPGLKLRPLEPEDAPAKFDLDLSLFESPNGLVGGLRYATDLFDATTAARMVEHLRTLLRSAVTHPEQALSSLPMMDEAEQRRVLVEWNDTAVDFGDAGCVHERISAQAARTPDAVAAISDAGSLTYAELDARSDLLARHLRESGVRPGTLVALCMERSLELPMALLGILKAGGAYVPLDPSYPRERLAFMLQDTAAPVLLTQQHLRGLLPAGPTVLCLDAGWGVGAREHAGEPRVRVSPDSPAYVIFTSGSTGQPKGTVIPHGALANHMAWLLSTFGISSEDRVLQKTPLSFDASVWECWAPLLVGAPLVLAPPDAHRDPAALLACVVRQRVTVLQVVPSMLRFMLEEEYLRRATHLRWLFCGGEALASELAPRLRAVLPDVRLVNLYGPTEVTIDSTFAQATGTESGLTVPIGRPVANTRAYVLDARMQLAPTGVPGELYLGGVQLAHGYLHRPHLTAERFVPNPFSTEPGARLYRTGDKVRWMGDGTLDYLGRIDFQVKLRGQRIELGEIEAALKQQPGVRDATVLVREDVPGNQRLVGYVVPAAAGYTPDTGALRTALQQHLPEYMVPSAFVTLETLPLTPNGKLDRKALPAPDAGATSGGFTAPREPTEKLLADLMASLLRVERVGVDDSFFALGGHSLLATQLVSRIRSTFGVELPLRAVFEAPTLSGLSQRITALQGGSTPRLQAPPLRPVPRTQALPLSFAQQRLWFIDQLEPGSSAYNLPAAVRMSGTLDVGALERALQALIARHESLRTTFAAQDGEAVQRIHPVSAASLPVVDLSGLPAEAREAEARRAFGEDARRPFDLVQGPLLRTTLLRLEGTEHVLLLTLHHIVSDGWSTGVLVRELAAVYGAEVSGAAPSLPPLPVQYADFAAWQREWLQGEVLESRLAYWKRQLGDAPALLELPTDRPRPALQSTQGGSLPVVFSRELSDALLAACQRHGVTPFMLLLAGFQVLLHRYSGQDDLVVGSPIAGRNRAETEGLIGFFVNTLVLRARIDPRGSFQALLQQVRETTLGAYEHQDVPFEKLVEELRPERSLSYSPLFQVMFAVQNTPSGVLELPGLKLRPLELGDVPAKFDLDLALVETPEGFAGMFQYATALFDTATAVRMLEHLRTLLRAAVERPELPIASLPLMDEAEQRRLLVEWNATAADFPADTCVHHLFSAQAARTPDALAVVSDAGSLTYAQLDARSSLLAAHLRQLGVRPDSFVALCMERSLELPVAVMGVLKAGGAYVPLDPGYPRERLAFMLRDTAAPVLLTQQHLRGLLPEGPTVVCLDAGWEDLAREGANVGTADVAVPPESAAYVIYTSGSTGQPKGTILTHRSLSNHSAWMRALYGMGPGERTLQRTALSFDVSVVELFSALLNGAAVVMAPPEANRDSALLLESLVRHHVTMLQVVPSHLRVLLDEPALRTATRLRWLISGGEALPPDLTPRVREVLPHVGLHNSYGPTETTIDATWWHVEDGFTEPMAPIGRPMANTQAYVLDTRLRPVPTGVPGELYVGGAGLARGYLNRPHLTAERFVPNPFSAEPGARMYRTGDKVRWRPDGTLDYLGRIDFQVKVRGLRIELGEIESALQQQPGVHDASVQVREDVPGNQRLVAYVVPATAGQTLDTDALRTVLQQHLPEYMVPSAFVVLEALPLSPNGKLDRKALPVPDAGAAVGGYFAPRTPTETVLAGIMAALLRVERVGVDDSFFSLGGHSLLATQLVSRIRSTFRVELPLRAVFEAPTLSGLAQRIASLQQGTAPEHQAPPLRPVPRTQALPLSFAQQRLWFIDQLEPGSAAYNLATAVRLTGTLDVAALEHALQALIERHESLRTTFSAQDGEAVQRIHPAQATPLPLVDLSTLADEAREAGARRLAISEAGEPFDLIRGPLFRTRLLRLTPGEHVLLLTLHHIISDGWSMSVLVRELAALYEAAASGAAPRLAPLPVQYADYTVWQRDWLRGEVLEAWLGYWKKQLGGAPHALELPTDRPRPAVQSFHGAAHSFTLPPELSEQLEALAHEHHATLFMVLLAAWQTLLSRYSGQDDIVVGSPIAGRNRAETEGLIGFFVNTLALRARLSGEDTFVSLLERVRETTLGAYAHQEVPFEKLVEVLQPERDLSRPPLFQVMFALQNLPDSELQLSGLKLSMLEAPNSTAKFELTLAMTTTAQGLAGTLEYNTDLFNASTAARLIEHFHTLLGAIASTPRQKLAALPLMSGAEQRQVLREWSATASDYPRESTLPEVFAQVVARYPDHTAVEFGASRLTYRQLDARANQLAHHLRRLGVTADSRVALAMERSLELIVSLVAILKAGGAYVPLDASYPRERLAGMVEDTRPQALVTTRALLPRLPAEGLSTVVLEDVALDSAPTHAPSPAALPDSLAYVDFTSGSTGRPKGVGTTHRNVLRTLLGVDFAHFGPEETLLQLAPISFDASTLEVWGALLHGARLVVMPPQVPSMEELGQVLRDARVTTLWLTAGLFTQVVEGNLEILRPVKQLLAGGDVVPAPHARRVLEELRIPVTNGYGPTETTVFAACFRMTDPAQADASVPIGRPIGSTRLYVLDAHGQPVPVGVTGELFIGGDGLARGYIGQPALTAERFLPDAFSDVPGARLYRTGDLVRWLEDGTLDFIGRADAQVKLRGFRIELGEVRAVLASHPEVQEAVVLAREDRAGDKRLVGYVAAPESLDLAALREFLKQRLPEYMVPSALVRLDALPLTPNGKVDRKALPVPDASATAAGQYVAPRTPTEEQLAALWAEVLGLPRVGIEDNFFDLGGHSLLAARMVSRLQKTVRTRVSLATLFQHPTVAALATVIDARREDPAPASNLVPLKRGQDGQRPLFLVHGGGGGVDAYADLARLLPTDRPVQAFRAPGLDGGELPPESVEALAGHYLPQLRAAQPHGPYLLGGWSFGGLVAHAMARQLQAQGEAVELLVMLDTPAPGARPAPEPDVLGQLATFGQLLELPWSALSFDVEKLRQLEGRERLAWLLEQVRRLPTGALDLDLDETERLFHVFQRLSAAQRHYVPGRYTGPVALLAATEGRTPPVDLGWTAWLTQAPRVLEVPGDHFTMLQPAHLTAVAERLAELLRALERDAA